MAYIAMSCVFLFSLVLISSTNSAPVSQEQFFDNYEHTEKYLQSCIPTLNVLFDTSTDPATSAGQPSIFREACPPESSQNPIRPRSNLCMLFAFRIHYMCQVSKAMQNNVNEFNTEMMKSFLQHSQTVMDEQKFCAEMTAPPPQGQSITLSRSETYYIRQAAGVQVALPLDPSTCSHLWTSMDCDQRELNSICQAYAFLATIEGPILESQKVALDTPGDLQPNEPQAPGTQAEDNASDQSKTAGNQGEQGKGVEETPDAELQPPSGEDAQPENPAGGPNNEIPVGKPGDPAEGSLIGNPPVVNSGNPAEGPNNEIPVGNPGDPAEGSLIGNPPVVNPVNPAGGPNNDIPVGNPGDPAEGSLIGNPPVANSGNPAEDPNNEIPVGNPGDPAEGSLIGNPPVVTPENPAEDPINPDVSDDWNREEDGSEESSHIEDNRPRLQPPDDFGSNDDSSEGGYGEKSEDDDGWEENQFENQDENHNIEPIPGNEENPGFQVQHPVENVKYDDGYDDDDAKTHFMAYSLTAIILILATYIMYHNKQKIIAVVVEGRNGRGRRRRGGSGYQKLDQSISEAMPSMHSQNA